MRKTTKIRTELPCLVKQKLRGATATSDFLVGKHEWAISKGGCCFPDPSLFPVSPKSGRGTGIVEGMEKLPQREPEKERGTRRGPNG